VRWATDTKSTLIVDDDPNVRKSLSDILRARGYAPITAATGKEALDIVKKQPPYVVLIDLRLEDMSGLKLMKGIKEYSAGMECVVITGYASRESAIEAINLGAFSYVQKPYDVEQLLVIIQRAVEKRETEEALRESAERFRSLFEDSKDAIYITSHGSRFIDVNQSALDLLGYSREEMMALSPRQLYVNPADILRCQKEIEEKGFVRDYELKLRKKNGGEIDCLLSMSVRRGSDEGSILEYQGIIRNITEQKRNQEVLKRTLGRLRKTLEGIVQTISLTVELRDPYTAGHQQRVANLARAIAEQIGLSEERTEGIYMAGIIHDLGKIAIPAEILSKPGKITEIEFSMIKTHPRIGYDILENIEFPWPIAEIVLQHHERMDGSGYPQGLSGEGILLEARILAVADVVEAMASHRPYRPALGIDKALEEITQNQGILYDPTVVEACLKVFTEKGFKFE